MRSRVPVKASPLPAFFEGASQAALALQDGDAVFFGAAGVDGGFVDDDVAGLEQFADGFAGADQGAQVRALVFVDGRRDGDDVDVGLGNLRGIAGEFEVGCLGKGSLASASRVLSLPARSSAMRRSLMSKPMTGKRFANSRARGRPT